MAGGPGIEVLFLVRHGKAEGAHPDGDRHRSLSAEGRRRIAELGPRASSQGFQVDLTLSSPYLRALQTRDLFGPSLGTPRNETSTALTPDADPHDALDELRVWESSGVRRVAVFTHNPFVTDLADLLLVPGSVSSLVFHTPTILALAFDAGLHPHRGRPLWILNP